MPGIRIRFEPWAFVELEKVGLEPGGLVAVEGGRPAAEKLPVEAPAPFQVLGPQRDMLDPSRHG